MVGPVFSREFMTAPRRPRLYFLRSVYAAALLLLMCTAWLILAGTQVIRDIGDMARFGTILFQLLAPLQLSLVLFFPALLAASAVAQEKDRRTLVLLLMTRLNNSEIVLGKLMASLLSVLVMIGSAIPIFMLMVLFGGISWPQVVRVFIVTTCAALAAGSLGAGLAFWREKTFQTLALTVLILIFWLGLGEVLGGGLGGWILSHNLGENWAAIVSPLRAVRLAAQPWFPTSDPADASLLSFVELSPVVAQHLLLMISLTFTFNALSIVFLRIWNPSRDVFERQPTEVLDTIWEDSLGSPRLVSTASGGTTMTAESAMIAESARQGHVDSVHRRSGRKSSRNVWHNPVLWREICTWAYGRKIVAIRVAYLLLFVAVATSLMWLKEDRSVQLAAEEGRTVIQATARPLIPLFFVSFVIINALAVTSITNERDGKSLDLLLVTDLSPREFILGKMGGIFWVTKEMIVLPMLLCALLYAQDGLKLDNLAYVVGGLAIMDLFVAMLGMHCGMHYGNSRTAIGLSLGTVFFLFLGVVTCILLMISFSGSFQIQLFPFLAFIAGGSIGLYVSLGARNPSSAIATASLLLPLATFYAITSFLLGYTLGVFLVVAATYGFATAAMLVPAISEYDFASTRTAQEE